MYIYLTYLSVEKQSSETAQLVNYIVAYMMDSAKRFVISEIYSEVGIRKEGPAFLVVQVQCFDKIRLVT